MKNVKLKTIAAECNGFLEPLAVEEANNLFKSLSAGLPGSWR